MKPHCSDGDRERGREPRAPVEGSTLSRKSRSSSEYEKWR